MGKLIVQVIKSTYQCLHYLLKVLCGLPIELWFRFRVHNSLFEGLTFFSYKSASLQTIFGMIWSSDLRFRRSDQSRMLC